MGFASSIPQRVWLAAVGLEMLLLIKTLVAQLADHSMRATYGWAAVMWAVGLPCGMFAATVWLGDAPREEPGGRRRSLLRLLLWTIFCAALPILLTGLKVAPLSNR